jgi:hypothetical protein
MDWIKLAPDIKVAGTCECGNEPSGSIKFPTYYETRRFITAFTIARHLSLSWSSSIQSISSHPTSWRSS